MKKTHFYSLIEQIVEQKHKAYGYHCSHCGKAFRNENLLKGHRQRHFRSRVKLIP